MSKRRPEGQIGVIGGQVGGRGGRVGEERVLGVGITKSMELEKT